MSARDKFVKYLREFNNKKTRTIKGISNNFKGKFQGISKKNLLRLSSLILATSIPFGTVACTLNSYDQKRTNGMFSTALRNDKHGNSNYLEKNEIFDEYLYIKENLKNKEDLTKEDIISISNSYKKIDSSIEYIDSLDETGKRAVILELPDMKGLYTDMKEDLIDLIVDKSVLLMPEGALDFQKELIANEYLVNTDYNSFENVVIAQTGENEYCVVSDEGKFFFEINISRSEDGTICIESTTNFKDIKQISQEGVSVVAENKDIPMVKARLEQAEEMDR